MFTVHCEFCDATTLIWPSQVEAVGNTEAGIVVTYHCSAGHRGSWVTGRAAAGREAVPA